MAPHDDDHDDDQDAERGTGRGQPQAWGSPGTSTRHGPDGSVYQSAGKQIVNGEELPPTH